MDYEAKLRRQSERNELISKVVMWPLAFAAGLGIACVISLIPGALFWLAWNHILVGLTGWSPLSFWAAWAVMLVFGFFFSGRGGSK